MTDRSHRLAAQGFGFAFAVAALTTLGAGQATAATPQQSAAPHARAEISKAFAATVKSTLPTRRVDIAIDPIDPNIRHMWPDLTDGSDTTVQGKS